MKLQTKPYDMFAPAAVEVARRADGTILLRSPQPLRPYARSVCEWLEHWAEAAPDRDFLLERGLDGNWQGVTYREAYTKARRIAAWLLRAGITPQRPVAILSDNSIEHALLMLGAHYACVPMTPVSPAYSLMSSDYGKLKTILSLLRPGLVYAGEVGRFAPALKTAKNLIEGSAVVASDAHRDDWTGAHGFSELLSNQDEEGVSRAYEAVTPDTVAKILFTSGSTGDPKGVLNTQRMLCASQEARMQVWPFLEHTPPVIIDWLPWNHTFGGNHNLNLILRSGGTLYIDNGKPVPGLFDRTIANLREVASTVYFNVPRGYDLLVTALRADETLRRRFFSKLQVIFYAAAALSQNLWEALTELSIQTKGAQVPMVSAWGSTETAPLATDCHFQAERAGVIGLPVPGCELKLVPSADKLEARVKGPNVMLGYYQRPDLTEQAFDEEGYYRIGDAVRFADPDHPERGLVFDGRVTEDFKLTTGTWVNVGAVRGKGIEALAPIAQDIVVSGHDRDEVGFLIFPNPAACRQLAGLGQDEPLSAALTHPAIRAEVARGLAKMKADSIGSSTYAARALLLEAPPSIDAGEITDKGYINQRAVLRNRSEQVMLLYAGGKQVIKLVS